MIVLSVFVSTKLTSVYSIYSMIFSALSLLLNSVYMAISFNLGQTFHKDRKKYTRLHDCYNNIFIGGITALMSVASLITIPFVRLYTRGIHDVEYIIDILPLLLCLMQLLSWSRYVSGNLTGIAGYAKSVSKIAVIEALVNVIASLVLVQFFGIIGVVIATVLALPIKVIYCAYLSDIKILKRYCWTTIKILKTNYACFFIIYIVGKNVQIEITSYLQFCVYGVILVAICGFIVTVANYFSNRNMFIDIKELFVKR